MFTKLNGPNPRRAFSKDRSSRFQAEEDIRSYSMEARYWRGHVPALKVTFTVLYFQHLQFLQDVSKKNAEPLMAHYLHVNDASLWDRQTE